MPDLDIIVNATGREEVAQQRIGQRPPRLMVLNVGRPYSWEDFWDLLSIDLSAAQDVSPLKVGIVGGGKGAGEVLQMKQAFLNLLLNAQDAMAEGGELTLKTRNSRQREVMVTVTDTGVGIPKESFSLIFEPFYCSKKAGSGVGLGLSVVYGIIRDHKGNIKVHSVVGQGTTFTIRLPAVKPGDSCGGAKKN